MRTNEERINAMHIRAAEIEREKRQKKIRVLQTVSVAACFILTIGLAVLMSGASVSEAPGNDPGSMSASILSGSGTFGYIVIGIIAFILGVTATLLCYSLKSGKKKEDNGDKE